MAQSQYIDDLVETSERQVVSTEHFGANIVANVNTIREDGPYQSVVENTGIQTLRYPGGTVTEQYFDPLGTVWDQLFGANPSDYAVAEDRTTILGPRPLFEYASANGVEIDYVLPTSSLVTRDANGRPIVDQVALTEVQATVGEILNGVYGEVTINTFEIGNEYAYYPDMTAEEYGIVANELVLAVQEEIDAYAASDAAPEDWEEPDILVQAALPWDDGDDETIIRLLDLETRGYIDGIVVHYYPSSLQSIANGAEQLEAIDIWESAEGFGELKFAVTEWNIKNEVGSDSGLQQGSSLISAFDEMISSGVDSATIWGVQYRFLDTELSTLNTHDVLSTDPGAISTRLTVPGEVFASLLESIVGLSTFDPTIATLLTTDASASNDSKAPSADLIVNAFGNEDRSVIYISSRSDQPITLELHLDQYFGTVEHAWGEILTSVDDPNTTNDESHPLSDLGLPQFETLGESELGSGQTITLPPYAIIRINVQTDTAGVTMRGHDPLVEHDMDYVDEFVGSSGEDSIHGFAGDDTLSGENGDDVIHGGSGSDTLNGGNDNDVLRGGNGDDLLYGNPGDDVISGNEGDDHLIGGDGNDLLVSGPGDNRLEGNSGDDTLIIGEGSNEVFGGKGSDYFLVSMEHSVVIEDWSFEDGDKLSLLGEFDDFEALVANTTETEGVGSEPGDLIITTESGGQLVISGAAGRLDELEGAIVDFTDEGIGALATSEEINSMSTEQIASYLDDMSTEEFQDTFLDVDPLILMATLDNDIVANLINNMDSAEATEFITNVGWKGFHTFFETTSPEDIEMFFGDIEGENLAQILDQIGGKEALALAQESGREAEANFYSAVEGTEYESLDPSKMPVADRPPDEDDDEDDEAEVSTAMDCFVATVVYEDHDHPDVWLLRWFRDEVLRGSFVGRCVIATYWCAGPRLAEWIYGRPVYQCLFLLIIKTLVWSILLMTNRQPGRQVDHKAWPDSRLVTLRNRNRSTKSFGRHP